MKDQDKNPPRLFYDIYPGPIINVFPDSIYVEVTLDGYFSTDFTIFNEGGNNLIYSYVIEYDPYRRSNFKKNVAKTISRLNDNSGFSPFPFQPVWLTLDGEQEGNGYVSVNEDFVLTAGFDAYGYYEDTYYAEIIINSNDPINPQIIIPVTMAVGEISPPNSPENVIIYTQSDSIHIQWDTVAGANSYKVYSSLNPYDNFENWALEADGITATSWSEEVINTKKFYYIVAENLPAILSTPAKNKTYYFRK